MTTVARTSVPAELVADTFQLLGDPNRIRLLLALRSAEELCVRDLASRVAMEESATSHALRLLRLHGVVRARREGRRVFYALADHHVTELVDVAVAHAAHDLGSA